MPNLMSFFCIWYLVNYKIVVELFARDYCYKLHTHMFGVISLISSVDIKALH